MIALLETVIMFYTKKSFLPLFPVGEGGRGDEGNEPTQK
jgi:hypothetical protein